MRGVWVHIAIAIAEPCRRRARAGGRDAGHCAVPSATRPVLQVAVAHVRARARCERAVAVAVGGRVGWRDGVGAGGRTVHGVWHVAVRLAEDEDLVAVRARAESRGRGGCGGHGGHAGGVRVPVKGARRGPARGAVIVTLVGTGARALA